MTEKKEEVPKNPIALFDFTIPVQFYSILECQELLRIVAKRWVFQLEEGKDGYQHYQVRLSLRKKIRYLQMKKKPVMRGHFSATSNPTYYAGNFFYVMKPESRIDGPWKDTDDIKVLTKQLKEFMGWELRPFQKEIIDEANKYDRRKINLIWNPGGSVGKSLLGEYMEYINLAEEIPPFRLMDDIFQWVCSRGIKTGFKKSYIVDLPRGMKKDRLGDFYSGIEVIKDGKAYDKRYSGQKCRFDRPRIFVFTNTLPNLDLMSHDRWVVWKIKDNFEIEVIV